MASAISGYISQIQNAVYGEQVRTAIVNALEACYSDVENPDLQSAAFYEAILQAYNQGILDIIEVTQVSQMTNENIIYRYMGTETGYTANTLYYYNGTAWVPIGSGVRTASTAAQMTDTSAIYKYTGSESGYTNGALYYYDGTAWVAIASEGNGFLPENFNINSWMFGDLNGSGAAIVGDIYAVSDFIKVKNGDTVKFAAGSGYKYYIARYNQSKVYVNKTTAQTADYSITYDGYIRLIFGTGTEENDTIEAAKQGVYIQSSVASAGIEIQKINDIPSNAVNYIAMTKLTGGYIENGTGGAITMSNAVAGGREKTTDFIPVTPGGMYTLLLDYAPITDAAFWAAYMFYDENKAPVGTRLTSGAKTYIDPVTNHSIVRTFISVPTTATIKYIRFSFRSLNGVNPMFTDGLYYGDYIPAWDDDNALTFIQYNPAPITVKYPFKSVNHRGYRENGIAENTLPAFKNSKIHGFNFVETDLQETADGELVLYHDDTLSFNGSTVNINTLTYAQLQTIDLGSGDYAGTKIPTFEEFIKLCKQIDLNPYVEIKQNSISDAGLQKAVYLTERYDMKRRVSWISFSFAALSRLAQIDSLARLGFVTRAGNINDAIALRNGKNEVFYDTNSLTAGIVEAAAAAQMPVEIWAGAATEANILSFDSIISGFTCDNLIAEDVIREHYDVLP